MGRVIVRSFQTILRCKPEYFLSFRGQTIRVRDCDEVSLLFDFRGFENKSVPRFRKISTRSVMYSVVEPKEDLSVHRREKCTYLYRFKKVQYKTTFVETRRRRNNLCKLESTVQIN